MTPLLQTLLMNFAVLLVAMLALWLVSLKRRDASIVDPFWGMGFVIVGWTGWSLATGDSPRSLILVLLTTIWGLRLSLFLLRRNLGHGEDHRYAAMRAKYGDRFWFVSLFIVFLLQGVILWFVSLPIQVAMASGRPIPLGWLDALGGMLWALGVFFETVGDWQLARFRGDPANAGRVLDHGLWRYTRHPNYFGDFCVWWGLYLIAAAGGAWWTIASPLAMSILLLRVSGVSLLESTIRDRRPAYAAYQSRTNAFFPGPPRRSKSGAER